jgi:hypothetical protein
MLYHFQGSMAADCPFVIHRLFQQPSVRFVSILSSLRFLAESIVLDKVQKAAENIVILGAPLGYYRILPKRKCGRECQRLSHTRR